MSWAVANNRADVHEPGYSPLTIQFDKSNVIIAFSQVAGVTNSCRKPVSSMPFDELVLVRQLYMGYARRSAIGPPSAMTRRVSSPRPRLLMSLGMLPSGRMVGRLYIIRNEEVRGSIPLSSTNGSATCGGPSLRCGARAGDSCA
jgi:hypothetical protein